MDYYDTLGVSRNASQDELKKAYKKASMQHHPDRGGDESKFKEINEAYSTLKDPQKRQEYDNPQPQFSQGFGPNGFHQQASIAGLAQLDAESIDGAGLQSNDHTSAPTVSALSESDSLPQSQSNTCGDSSELESNQLCRGNVSAKESMMLMRRCLS